MKVSTLLLSAILSLMAISANSQTSEEEYNYLKKGYKIQIESGLDMKKGYSIKDFGTWGTDYSSYSRNTTFKGLYRDGETTPCAVLLIVQRTDNDYIDYVCIPHMNSSDAVWKTAFHDWRETAEDWSAGRGYSWGMIKFISYQFSNQ